jgi:hypothetical protein
MIAVRPKINRTKNGPVRRRFAKRRDHAAVSPLRVHIIRLDAGGRLGF